MLAREPWEGCRCKDRGGTNTALACRLPHGRAWHHAAGTLDSNWFTLNRALNGGSVWQNDCKDVVHTNNRFDNNTADRGSAGVEMNQITSIDISACTFNSGKGAKGSGLYLQVRRRRAIPQTACRLAAACARLHAIRSSICTGRACGWSMRYWQWFCKAWLAHRTSSSPAAECKGGSCSSR